MQSVLCQKLWEIGWRPSLYTGRKDDFLSFFGYFPQVWSYLLALKTRRVTYTISQRKQENTHTYSCIFIETKRRQRAVQKKSYKRSDEKTIWCTLIQKGPFIGLWSDCVYKYIARRLLILGQFHCSQIYTWPQPYLYEIMCLCVLNEIQFLSFNAIISYFMIYSRPKLGQFYNNLIWNIIIDERCK